MRFYSYVVARDFGFAPNPFNGFCTLATCKPRIRKGAAIGDWVIGTGSSTLNQVNHLIFAMKVNEKLTFDEYWNHSKFQTKKPVMNGSLKKMYGDNIYCSGKNGWVQSNSHHSLADGSVNIYNLTRDTSVNLVLISEEFYYFGGDSIAMPDELSDEIRKKGPGCKCPDITFGSELLKFLNANYTYGYLGDPRQFLQFSRYDGQS